MSIWQTGRRVRPLPIRALLALPLALVAATPGHAGTFTAFGPQGYVRGAGTPVAEVTAFSVRNPATQYTLQIHNGGLQDGEFDKVSSSVIRLNGVQVVGPAEFNQNVSVVEKPVSLNADNSLSVELRGQPGGGITIRIVGLDEDLPTITAAVSPAANAAGWHQQDATVSFTCADPTSGIASCSPPVLVSAEGADRVVSGTATDQAGNSATTSVTINLDKTAPAVAIASPAEGSTVASSPVTVTGTITELLSGLVGVTCNGAAATLNETAFSCDVPVSAGTNTLLVQATDRAGNVGSASRQVTFTPAPVVPAGFGVVLGQVLDATTGHPLSGATVKALGTTSQVQSDTQGRFTLPAPAGEQVAVHFSKGSYVDAKAFAVVEDGRETSVGTIRLQPFDQVATLIGAQGGTHTDSTGTVTVIFPANAVNTTTAVTATVFPTAADFPVTLPEGQAFLAGVQFTPENLAFGTPVTVRIANTLNLPPNTPVPFAFANHSDQNADVVFFDPGTARVSPDGQFLEAQLSHFSCIGLVLPFRTGRPPIQIKSPDKAVESSKQKCCTPIASRVGANDGTLFLDQVLPATRVLGRSNSLTFTYSSATADPHPLILMEATLDPAATTLPEQVRWSLRAGALEEERLFTPQAGTFRYAWSWEPRDRDGNLLPTGSHRVEVTLSHDYEATLATSNSFGGPPIQDLGIPVPGLTPAPTRPNARIVINNQRQSPFGAGWGLQGLQRLHPQPDGSVVVTEGDGTALTFRTIPVLYATVSPGTTTFGGLSALDPERGDLQSVFPTVVAPKGVATSPTGEFVFVATEGGVRVIDARSQAAIGSVPIGFAQDLVVSPDGATLYVASSNPRRYSVVDVRSQQIVFSLALSGAATAITLSPDGSRAYVAQQSVNDVLVIDTETHAVVATVPLLNLVTTRAIAISEDGQRLYVGVGPGVAVVNTTTNALQTTLSLGHPGTGLALSPAGRLFVASGGTTVTMVDTTTLQVVGAVTLPVTNARGMTVHPDGTEVFVVASVTNAGPGFVFVLDAATGALVNDFALPDGFAEDVAFQRGSPHRPLAPPGDFSTLTRNDNGTLADPSDDTWVRRMKDGTEHLFSATGLHLETRDRGGNRTLLSYDGAGRLLSITDPAGGVSTFGYAGGTLGSVTDPAGRTTQFSIDGAGNLLAVTLPDGAVTQYSYDSRHRLLTRTDPRGAATQYEYDGFGRLSRVTHPTGEERTLLPSDAQGLLNNVPGGTPAAPIATDVLAQLTDGLSRTTQIRTDPLGAATQTVDPLGRATAVQRNGHGLPTRITRPDGAVITLRYDGLGNLLQTEQLDPLAGTFRTFFTYEPTFNQVTGITDPRGNTTSITYDGNGNPVMITDALNTTTTLAYDGRGLLTSVTDAQGGLTAFTYDARGNLVTTTDPLGNVTTLTYDAAGNVVASSDALGRSTQFAYDAMNRLIQVTDAATGITRYGYDGNGNLVSVTDAKGQQTTFSYDPVNQLSQTTNPVGQAKTFFYDLSRNLVSTTDAKGQTISFTYDAANQLVAKMLPGGEVVGFAYDPLGNLTSAQDADSALSFRYDGLNRLTRVDTAATAAQAAATMTYVYDRNGNRTQLSGTIGGSGVLNTYTYDALNRLTRLTGLGGQVNFAYDTLSRRTGMTRPNGVATTYTYDPASQLTSLVHTVGGVPIASFSYAYDPVGNRTSLTDLDGTHDYAYDALNRLTQATHPQPANPAESFAYDPVGNRTGSHLASSQIHDAANRLLEDSNFTYTYDESGNLTSKTNRTSTEVTTYTYDAESQLIRVDRPGTVADYRYDALGRRIAKLVNGVSTRFVYDNEDMVAEVDSGSIVRALYTHGPGIDEPLAMFRSMPGTNTFLFHADGLGSITHLTSTAGAPTRSYTYDSFGRIVSQSGTLVNPYTYTAREFDAESGLYYYRARYYDPTIGRFLREDPIGFIAGPNFYAYIGGNPQRFIDPLGMQPLLSEADVFPVRLASFGFGGVFGIYDVNWSTDNPTATVISLTTPQLGAGFNFCFDIAPTEDLGEVRLPTIASSALCNSAAGKRSYAMPAEPPLIERPFVYAIGTRYLGLSFPDNFSRLCANLGLAVGPLPINVSAEIVSVPAVGAAP